MSNNQPVSKFPDPPEQEKEESPEQLFEKNLARSKGGQSFKERLEAKEEEETGSRNVDDVRRSYTITKMQDIKSKELDAIISKSHEAQHSQEKCKEVCQKDKSDPILDEDDNLLSSL